MTKSEFMENFREFVKWLENEVAEGKVSALEVADLQPDQMLLIRTGVEENKEFILKHGFFAVTFTHPKTEYDHIEFLSEALAECAKNKTLASMVSNVSFENVKMGQ